ncbi:MAG TPA: CoA pyrophosphatase [Chloroflexia bacterium]|jgi:8-oxo-dGTP pyrophosphatase MutT (NUDIX family)
MTLDTPSVQPVGDLRPIPKPGTTYRKAAVLLLLYPRAGEEYVVFMRRTDTVEHHKGQISFPGGAQDPTDPDITYTALREAHEELGINPAQVEVVATLQDVYVPVSWFVITPVVARLKEGVDPSQIAFSPNPGEVAEIIEVPLRALRDEATHHVELRTVNEVTHTIHYYTYGPYEIWGATGRIIYEFLNEGARG